MTLALLKSTGQSIWVFLMFPQGDIQVFILARLSHKQLCPFLQPHLRGHAAMSLVSSGHSVKVLCARILHGWSVDHFAFNINKYLIRRYSKLHKCPAPILFSISLMTISDYGLQHLLLPWLLDGGWCFYHSSTFISENSAVRERCLHFLCIYPSIIYVPM
jgi:hypothetical protein